MTDAFGESYHDMCGAYGDVGQLYSNVLPHCDEATGEGCKYLFIEGTCENQLAVQLFSYLIIKPASELILQTVRPWFKHKRAKHSRRQSEKRVRNKSLAPGEVENSRGVSEGSESTCHFLQAIENELMLPEHSGVFTEYSTKALQFGYLAMFSSVFPLGAIAVAISSMCDLYGGSHAIRPPTPLLDTHTHDRCAPAPFTPVWSLMVRPRLSFQRTHTICSSASDGQCFEGRMA